MPIHRDRSRGSRHNGIIENFQELKDELLADGRASTRDTDTEVVAQLLTSHLERQLFAEEAMGKAMERLRGAFALVALFSGRHDILMGARRGTRWRSATATARCISAPTRWPWRPSPSG